MIRRTSLPLLILCLLMLAVMAVTPGRSQADPHLTVLRGNVAGFDTASTLLTVNAQIGRRQLFVNSQTLILLNNHTATTGNIQAGDTVTVHYRFDTLVAHLVSLTRERSQRGRVITAAANSVGIKVRGAQLSLTTNARSLMNLSGIRIVDPRVLEGLEANTVYEPSQNPLLLRLQANGKVRKGVIAGIDSETGTVTLTGKGGLTLVVHENVTVRRGGLLADVEDLRVGDRIRAVTTRRGGVETLLAVNVLGG